MRCNVEDQVAVAVDVERVTVDVKHADQDKHAVCKRLLLWLL